MVNFTLAVSNQQTLCLYKRKLIIFLSWYILVMGKRTDSTVDGYYSRNYFDLQIRLNGVKLKKKFIFLYLNVGNKDFVWRALQFHQKEYFPTLTD